MGKALQCPACRCAHPLDTLPVTPTFRCHRCGQVLKVPGDILERAARRSGAAVPVADALPFPGPASVSAGSVPFDDASYGAQLPSPPHAAAPRGSLVPERIPTVAPWWVRLIAWGIAIPAGGFLALRISSLLGLFGLKQRRSGIVNMLTTALDKGLSGMGSLMGFAVFWAFIIAVLVTVMLGAFIHWRSRSLGRRAAGVDSTPSGAQRDDAVKPSRQPGASPMQSTPPATHVPAAPPHRDATDDWELPPRRT